MGNLLMRSCMVIRRTNRIIVTMVFALLAFAAADQWGRNATASPLVHSSANLGIKYGTWGTGYNCTTCHSGTTDNIKRVAASIVTPTGARSVVFDRLTSSVDRAGVFGDDLRAAGNGSTNVCEACHHNTTHHQYSSAKITDRTQNPHYNRQDCMSCHLHSAAFKASCDSCHGNPPNSGTIGAGGLAKPATNALGTTPPASGGAHMAHAGAPRNMACNTCHNGYGAKAMPSNTIDIGFNVNNGNFPGFGPAAVTTGTLNAPNSLNAPYKWAPAAGTTVTTNAGNLSCSLYCHGSTLTGGSITNPNWAVTDGTQDACGTCHGASAGAPPTTGSHGRHAGAAGLALTCDKCHGPHPDNSHVDGTVTWNLSAIAATAQYKTPTGSYATTGSTGGLAPSAAYGTCTNISCHSSGTGVWTGTASGGTTPVWGSPAGCNACHGNTVNTNYLKALPTYASGSPKPNAHPVHQDINDASADGSTGTGPQCKHCHYTITTSNTSINGTAATQHAAGSYTIAASGSGATFRNGDNVAGAGVAVTLTYTYRGTPNISSCANVSCHPTGLAGTRAASTTTWNTGYACTDCHKVDIANTTGYHHAMRNYSGSYAAYPTSVPQGDAATGSNSNSRRCTMCHVDHDIFSPAVNSGSAGRAYNLRTAIDQAPTAAANFTNSDYVGTSGGTGGICISCHNAELTKSTTRIKAETNSTRTVAVPFADYSGSAHEYGISSAMKGPGGGTFNANCSKCHNGKNGEPAVFSQMTTAVHDRGVRRLYASLGANLADGNDENFCYRCHSKTSDASPGGGPAKTVANRDYYGTAVMTAPAEGIFAQFQKSYKHNVAGYSGLHKPSPTNETQAYLAANRHVECADCHDPHAATNANPVRGVNGLDPTTPAAGGTPTYTVVTVSNPDHQYKLCFKCHTDWAGYGTGTNLAVEFNTNNVSYHWVENDKGAARASTSYGNFNTTYVYKMMPRYSGFTNTQLRSVKMRCSDCHGPDGADGGVTVPEGPHGSTIAKILKVPAGSPYTTWNSTVQRTNGTVWCFNCHDPAFTNTGFSGEQANSHTYGSGSKHDINCQYCHISVPHGSSTLKRLLNPATFGTGINSINSGTYTQSNGHGQVIPGCT